MAHSLAKLGPKQTLAVAERFRHVLSRWVRTTREQTQTPSTAEAETLRLLQDHGPATIAVLAQLRSVKHQSMRLVVERLALEGAVSKRMDANDRRNQVVSITARGRSIIRREQNVRAKWIAGLLAGHTPAELKQVEDALDTLEGLLEQHG